MISKFTFLAWLLTSIALVALNGILNFSPGWLLANIFNRQWRTGLSAV